MHTTTETGTGDVTVFVTSADRARFANVALMAYAAVTESWDGPAAVEHLLIDLRYACARDPDLDFDEALRCSAERYAVEVAREQAREADRPETPPGLVG